MRLYNNILVFDLTSYGSALSILNQYADDTEIKVFEISPIGISAQLILVSKESQALRLVQKESQRLFGANIKSSFFIENVNDVILNVYLSQNKPKISKSIAIFESGSLSSIFSIAAQAVENKIELVDFRTIRTEPKNVILIVTAEDFEKFSLFKTESDVRLTQIEKVDPTLKSYFEINVL